MLSREAAEEEWKLAEEYARHQSKAFRLDGFHEAVPVEWYTNDRLTNAMTEANPRNKEFIDYAKNTDRIKKLKKQFEKSAKTEK